MMMMMMMMMMEFRYSKEAHYLSDWDSPRSSQPDTVMFFNARIGRSPSPTTICFGVPINWQTL